MSKITLILASVLLAFSATNVLGMDGQADRFNEARSYPVKTVDTVADVRTSAR